MIYPADPAELDPLLDRRPDLHSRRFWVLHFPFDLERPRPNRRYEAATVSIAFDDERVTALDLMLTDQAEQADIRGIGRNVAAWDLRPVEPEAGLRPRSRVMQLVLDAPAGSTDFPGALSASVTVARVRGSLGLRKAVSQNPLRFTLSTDGAFTATAGR
jgi:hypothetical protein